MSQENPTDKDSEDIKIENDASPGKSQQNTQKDQKPYSSIINELTEILNKANDQNSEGELYPLVNKFKAKYREELLKTPLPSDIEGELIEKLQKHHDSRSEGSKSYVSFLFDLFELLPYFYHPEQFEISIEYEAFNSSPVYDKVNKLELFKSIKPKESKMNSLVDTLMLYLFENYTDFKALYIENNLFINYPSRSVFISFKFIALQLFLYEKITANGINKNLYNESLSTIGKLLLQEASYYNQKFNNEYYNNAFSQFDFNTDDKVKRKLSMDEFKFLTQYLFKFLLLILTQFSHHINSFDFSAESNRKIFFGLLDSELKKESFNLKTENDLNVYTYYIVMSFACDVVAFMFTNFLYLNKTFTEQKELHFETDDPFFTFVNDWKLPSYHKELIAFIRDELFIGKIHDKIKFIEIFLSLCDIKNQYQKEYEEVFQANSTLSYFLIQPVNSIGLSILIWMSDKKFKYKENLVYKLLYNFDIRLPLIASLLKSGHSLRYIAIEMILDFTDTFKFEIVPKMNSLVHYSFDDIFNDILEFIGGTESESMRRYVNSKLPAIIGVLSNEAKFEFFNYFIDTALVTSEDKNLNDDKISYFIQIIKNCLNENLKLQNYKFFSEEFVKKIIRVFAIESYEKIFIFEIIETISQTLNFAHFAILKDKQIFKGSLNIYNKEYLYKLRKNSDEIVSLVEKFVKSSNEEKMKTLRLNPDDEREDIDKALNLKNNQCKLLLDLINTVDNLIMKSLKELEGEKK